MDSSISFYLTIRDWCHDKYIAFCKGSVLGQILLHFHFKSVMFFPIDQCVMLLGHQDLFLFVGLIPSFVCFFFVSVCVFCLRHQKKNKKDFGAIQNREP